MEEKGQRVAEIFLINRKIIDFWLPVMSCERIEHCIIKP